MSLMFNQKEDLRLRMADLEKKLAESEEERFKLEKTCNVLMRAFREEEKMQYKVLNQKYEKFLDDCNVRKRRNDIILRSLCRIEDRSRALFAKTERLKLLKDRYVSYLNISDYKKGEIRSQSWRTYPISTPSDKIPNVSTSKYVRWTTPLATHLKTEQLREPVRDVSEKNANLDVFAGDLAADKNAEKVDQVKSEEIPGYRDRKANDKSAFYGVSDPLRFRGIFSPAETRYDSYNPPESPVPSQTKNEKLSWNQINAGNYVSEENKTEMTFREKKVAGYHESVEKIAENYVSSEAERFASGNAEAQNDPFDGKIIKKADVEKSEKKSITDQYELDDDLLPRINHGLTLSPNKSICDEENREDDGNRKESEIKSDSQSGYQEESVLSEASPKSSKPLPMGLDGVDYQNETYPESYYEQPVHHHNHTSIASDVILEEDETEQELDDEEKNFIPEDVPPEIQTKGGSRESPGILDEPDRQPETVKQMDEPNKGHIISGRVLDEVKSQGSDSEKSFEAKQSDKSEKSERALTEKPDKNKATVKSNLIHLLESDSESFQIEHGDVVSGNEDTDFDFSFHQN